jgi:hypothetical protein
VRIRTMEFGSDALKSRTSTERYIMKVKWPTNYGQQYLNSFPVSTRVAALGEISPPPSKPSTTGSLNSLWRRRLADQHQAVQPFKSGSRGWK